MQQFKNAACDWTIVTSVTVWFLSAGSFVFAAEAGSQEQAFLQRAAEGQQLEIALGQLAIKKALNERVKELGARILQDEQKASQQVRALALKEGIALPADVGDKTREKQKKFSHYAGMQFDYAYVAYLLQDHSIEVRQLEQNAETLKDPDVKKWATTTLHILKGHLDKAHAVASLIGLTQPGGEH
jgi:putative membrane protein